LSGLNVILTPLKQVNFELSTQSCLICNFTHSQICLTHPDWIW
jgi:hypothetical protein